MGGITIDIKEWDELLPEQNSPLYQYFLQDEASKHTVKILNDKNILNIVELKDGIKITSNSYVGKIKIGELQINIRPKIEGMPLYQLLKYAYGLRDLALFAEALHNIDAFPFHDLLIYQLYAEAEDLIYRGLNKKYMREEKELETPKGRVNIRKLATRSQVQDATLPCIYFKRTEDNILNRVLLSGLYLAIQLTEDLHMKIQLFRLCKIMEDGIKPVELNRTVLKKGINFDLLKQELSGDVVDGEECYDFTWVGKKAAIVEGNTPIRKTLRPCIEESKDWESTGNLYIEGDNLDVLKLLQESYLNSIKMIYIDPPYNTGNDFIYKDNFSMDKDEYEEELGLYDEDDNRLFKNTETNGRFHSDWCSMIFSRIKLANRSINIKSPR
jgi:hypothetical protein